MRLPINGVTPVNNDVQTTIYTEKGSWTAPVGYEFCGVYNDATHWLDQEGETGPFNINDALREAAKFKEHRKQNELVILCEILSHGNIKTIRKIQ